MHFAHKLNLFMHTSIRIGCLNWLLGELLSGWADVSTRFHLQSFTCFASLCFYVQMAEWLLWFATSALQWHCFNRFQFHWAIFATMLFELITEKIAIKYTTVKTVMAQQFLAFSMQTHRIAFHTARIHSVRWYTVF